MPSSHCVLLPLIAGHGGYVKQVPSEWVILVLARQRGAIPCLLYHPKITHSPTTPSIPITYSVAFSVLHSLFPSTSITKTPPHISKLMLYWIHLMVGLPHPSTWSDSPSPLLPPLSSLPSPPSPSPPSPFPPSFPDGLRKHQFRDTIHARPITLHEHPAEE